MTLLIKGPNKHTIEQIKDAIYDGIRAVSNLLKDRKSSGSGWSLFERGRLMLRDAHSLQEPWFPELEHSNLLPTAC